MLLINLYLKNLEFAGYQIPTVFLLSVIGYLVGITVIFWETKRRGLSYKVTLMILLLWNIVGGILTRLFFALSHFFLHQDLQNQKMLMGFYPEKKVYFGFFLSVFIIVWLGVYLSKERKNYYKYLDVFMLGHIVLMLFFRWGNVVSYFHPGKITNVPWGVYNLGQIRHEPSLYEVLSLAVLIAIVLFLRKKVKLPGFISLIMVLWISLSRFLIDFFRSDDFPQSNFHFSNGLTMNQVAFYLVFMVSFFILLKTMRDHKGEIWKSGSLGLNQISWNRNR